MRESFMQDNTRTTNNTTPTQHTGSTHEPEVFVGIGDAHTHPRVSPARTPISLAALAGVEKGQCCVVFGPLSTMAGLNAAVLVAAVVVVFAACSTNALPAAAEAAAAKAAAKAASGNPFARVHDGFTSTPLDDYVNRPDSTYSWFDTGLTFSGPGYKGHILNMTSQTWLTAADTNRPVWWHFLAVVVPDRIDFVDAGMLYITGDSNNAGPPSGKGEDELLCIALALADHTVCSVLFQIPNAPIIFPADPLHKSRTEDAIIAWTWYHFIHINASQPDWLLRLPMTKAAVRAMDTTTAFIQNLTGEPINRFIVAGASKRGWTTWTTGAVDKRVVAIIPIVMDLLNYKPNIHHFYRAFGGWTFAFSDYYALNFTQDIDHPNMQPMFDVIDPFQYKDRLTMPKLVIDSGGDEFFMPDDNWYWWDDMVGELHLLMVQNAEHSMATGIPEVIPGAASFAHGVLSGTPRPEMSWKFGKTFSGGNITVTTNERPSKIIAHYADTLDGARRDWRLIIGPYPDCPLPVKNGGACLHPVLWKSQEVFQIAPMTWTVAFDAPEDRWRAFFIEVEFRGDTELPHIQTTQVNIIPDTFPFPDCSGPACKGTLV
eukprot:m.315662 g.315662  ORF g.315662 m.315662 type:complete len:599 (-) comp19677_c5_seq3:2185-3981(-)